MKVAAIIAEYNPLHNGHEFQIKRAKQKEEQLKEQRKQNEKN
jgi:predicted nucleotidyltransferase